MRKVSLISVCILSLILVGGIGTSQAIEGGCDKCHTMHNSEGGTSMRVDKDGNPIVDGDSLEALLKNDCLGCHTTNGSEPFADDTPYVVLSGADDDRCLAGGFFLATEVDEFGTPTDNNGDENHDIDSTATPAGFDANETTWYTGHEAGGGNGLSCAGASGCHGDQTSADDMSAISGGHHTPGAAYRMLYVGEDGVKGSGAKDYEAAIIKDASTGAITSGDDQNVNIYSAGVNDPSISEFCAKCHGDFHNESGDKSDCGDSTWIRHPTDALIPSDWTIASATLDGDDYKHNPVGYDGASINQSAKKATCLSCHRAHGTENDNLLRWAYDTQIAGSATVEYGCLGCHNKQRGQGVAIGF